MNSTKRLDTLSLLCALTLLGSLLTSEALAQPTPTLEDYQDRLKAFQKADDYQGVMKTQYQIAMHYLGKHEPEQAVRYFQMCANTSLLADNEKMMASCYYHIGETYAGYNTEESLVSAFTNLYKAIQIQKDTKDTLGVIKSLLLQGKLLFNQGDYTKSALSLEEAEIKASSINAHKEKIDLYLLLSKVYNKLNDQQKALLYHNKYMNIELGTMHENKKNTELTQSQKRIEDLEKEKREKEVRIANLLQREHEAKAKMHQIETEFKAKEAKMHKEANKRLEEKILLEQWLRWTLLVLVVLSLILIYMLIRSNFQKTKANQFLGEQKRTIERDTLKLKKENDKIISQQDHLRHSKAQLERELRELKMLRDAQSTLMASTQTTIIEKIDQAISYLDQANCEPSALSREDLESLKALLREIRSYDFNSYQTELDYLSER